MRASPTAPRVSIVLATDSYDTLRPVVASLGQQRDRADFEVLVIGTADLEHYERTLDFRDGVLRRSLIWRTPSGKRVKVDSTRMASMTQRHLVVLTLEVTMLHGDAPLVVSSQLLNRQDGQDEA